MILWVFTSGLDNQAYGQDFNDNRAKYRLAVHRTNESMILDGVLDEATWQNADIATDFYRVLPIDTG